ncbi:MAG: hypothetical protein HWE20_00630 [Gammaproteobacteria bacterium]|nr:hypothetical protein [Gammaproteobacteria bacterium]
MTDLAYTRRRVLVNANCVLAVGLGSVGDISIVRTTSDLHRTAGRATMAVLDQTGRWHDFNTTQSPARRRR